MQDMNEELIKFEVAQSARQKGFPVEMVEHRGYFVVETNEGNKLMYHAPQSVVQKWLREVHKICVESTYYSDFANEINRFDLWCYNVEGELFSSVVYSDYIYKSYEEALEAGLLAGLNLIKDKKDE